ncbi:MAG: tetraacyldisaccharide 4'-kinase [Alphaproteobacteria bacterium]
MRAPDFWRHDGLASLLLLPASAAWRMAAACRASRPPESVGIPVVCVGNVVSGGAGKTPAAMAVAAGLAGSGRNPHFLTRGYGGSERGPVAVETLHHTAAEVGDEALLLAAHCPTWVARDRVAGAHAAAAAGADVVVMDDGFQNPSLKKNLSFLVIDGGFGLGNGRTMPAGPLREPFKAALARADAVILLGEDRTGIEARIAGRLPVVAGRYVPTLDAEEIAGKRVVAFAGIGRPEKFFETLVGMGCQIAAAESFADHYRFTEDDVMRLIERAAAEDAVAVTTEKDFVRLPSAARDMVKTVPIRIEWRDEGALEAVLGRLSEGLAA